MESWEVFGHQNIKNILEKQGEVKNYSHAYLFSGPDGIGKKALALEFAKKILGTENLSNHPDFNILDVEGEIASETILEFSAKLSYKPFISAKKVAVINNAHNLNSHSGNALLKTLEEPSSSTIIILIAGSGSLLPTIVSRCQVFNFSSFSPDQLKEFSILNNLKISNSHLNLSFGKIGRLKVLLENEEFLNSQKELVEKYDRISALGTGERLASISKYAEMENDELSDVLMTWQHWQILKLKNFPSEVSRVKALTDSWQGLKTNKNKKLVLQSLFLKI